MKKLADYTLWDVYKAKELYYPLLQSCDRYLEYLIYFILIVIPVFIFNAFVFCVRGIIYLYRCYHDRKVNARLKEEQRLLDIEKQKWLDKNKDFLDDMNNSIGVNEYDNDGFIKQQIPLNLWSK